MTVFKYEEICNHFISAIDRGLLKNGEKMSSLRKSSREFGCAISVVMQAYEELERRGYVRSVEKSGFFVLPREKDNLPQPQKYDHTMEPRESRPSSMISTIMDMAHRRDFLSFSATIPDLSLLPTRKISSLIADNAKKDFFYVNHYTGQDGEPELREEIARLMLRRGVFTGPEEIIVTNGCTEALFLAINAVTSEGDAIAIESPGYLGMITMLKKLNRRVVEIPTRADSGMELDQLEDVLRRENIQAVVVSPVYQNPLGFVMSEDDKKRLYELSESYDTAIIEDDIYGDCSFSGKAGGTIKSFDRSGRVLYCSSFSKTLSPGLRTGWMLPGRYHSDISESKQISGLGGAIILEKTVARILQSGHYDYHLKYFRKKIASQTNEIRNLIEEHFPEGTRISTPSGGYFLWVEMDKSIDSQELFQWAYERKIGIIPGPVYSASGKFRNCIRISCGSPITEKVVRGIETLGNRVSGMLN